MGLVVGGTTLGIYTTGASILGSGIVAPRYTCSAH